MTILIVAFAAIVAGYWIGHLHALWLIKDELNSVARRVGEYTDARKPVRVRNQVWLHGQKISDETRTINPRKLW